MSIAWGTRSFLYARADQFAQLPLPLLLAFAGNALVGRDPAGPCIGATAHLPIVLRTLFRAGEPKPAIVAVAHSALAHRM